MTAEMLMHITGGNPFWLMMLMVTVPIMSIYAVSSACEKLLKWWKGG